GDHAISIIIQDPAGNQSPPSDSQVITIDTLITQPTIVHVNDDVGAIKGSVANNGITDDNKPTMSGKAEAGSTVTIKNGSTVLGSVVADASGNWSFTPSQALADGKYTLTVVATDIAGNVSAVSDSFSFTVDTVIAKPTIANVLDDVGSVKGSVANNGVTDDNKPTLSGKAEAGSIVLIQATGKVNGVDVYFVAGSAVADASGNWSITLNALADGQYLFSVTATDAAGNESVSSDGYSITIKSEMAKPTITTVSDDVGSVTGSIANNGTTDDNKPTLSGKAEAGSTVTIKNGSTVLGSVVADASGNWTFTPSSALADGKYTLSVVATDVAGNVSTASDAYTINVVTSVAKPTIT
ncbi:Ig-like domain-containing protein, partial [Aeromonas hydrophila]